MMNSGVASHNIRDRLSLKAALCKAQPCLSMGSVEAPNSLEGVPWCVEKQEILCILFLLSAVSLLDYPLDTLLS